jgi:large subunit ribosomal protein L25
MATATLNASTRAGTGKGVARSLRREGQVPGVIYGHAREPKPLAVNARELGKLLSHISAASTVVELSIEGATSRTLIREIQRHPVRKHEILHVDFQELVAGEQVSVSVPLVYVGGEALARATGGILDQIMHEVELLCDPASIPNHIDVDVSGLTIGHSLHASDLTLPAGTELVDDPERTVCVLSAPKTSSETPAAGVEVISAEPELIRKPKAEDEA